MSVYRESNRRRKPSRTLVIGLVAGFLLTCCICVLLIWSAADNLTANQGNNAPATQSTVDVAASAPQQQAYPADQGDTYYSMLDVQQISLQQFADTARGKLHTVAILVCIALVLILIGAFLWLYIQSIIPLFDLRRGWLAWCVLLIVAVLAGQFGYRYNTNRLDAIVQDQGQKAADAAMNAGYNDARKALATNVQYIVATAVNEIMIPLDCHDTTSAEDWPGSPDDCGNKTGWYYEEAVDSRTAWECVSWDDEGDCDRHEYVEHHKTHVVPYFPQIWRYALEYNTKAKYIHPSVSQYEIYCSDNGNPVTCARDDKGNITDERNPIIVVSTSWRAMPDSQLYPGADKSRMNLSKVDFRVPASWQEVRDAKNACTANVMDPKCHTVTHYYLGKYFNWVLGSKSPLYIPYDGPYNTLKTLTNDLPAPNGTQFNFTDAYGQPAQINTLLYSEDGDLANKLAPVFFIGFDNVDESVKAAVIQKAQELGGHIGPNKTAFYVTYIVNESIVAQLGGLQQTGIAILGLVNDESRWGLLKAPKNQAATVYSAPADLSVLTGREFIQVLNIGNTKLIDSVRQSVSVDQPLPFTVENLFGVFHSYYSPDAPQGFTFTPMDQAGGVVGMIYEKDPNWTPPDPKSNECNYIPALHAGYQRPEMCGLQLLETNIPVNKKAMSWILAQYVIPSANTSVDTTLPWALFVIALLFAGFSAYTCYEAYESNRRYRSRW